MAETRLEQHYPEMSLRDIYHTLFRHKRKAIVFLLVVVATVSIGTFLAPEIYRSEAKLLVKIGRESVSLDPTATTRPIVHAGQDREKEINSEMEILTSRELAEKVVDRIGVSSFREGADDSATGKLSHGIRAILSEIRGVFTRFTNSANIPESDKERKERDETAQSFMKALDIEAVPKSNIISIAYENKRPELAQDVLETLIEVFLDKHIDAHRTVGSYQFFLEQTEQLHDQLTLSEKKLRELKNRDGIASLDEQRLVFLERVGALRQKKDETKSALAASEARLRTLKEGLNYLATEEMRKRLHELKLKEQELLSTFAEDSVPVLEIRRQIREARSLLSKTERTQRLSGETRKSLQKQELQLDVLREEAAVSSLKAAFVALEMELIKAGEELKALNDTEVQIAEAMRDLRTQGSNYQKYAESLEQARIDQALEMEKISNISVVQPATYPVKPVRPRKALNLTLGLLLGTLGGLGLAFFSGYMDHSFTTPESVEERLQLPMLSAIPRFSSNGSPQTQTRKKPLVERYGEFTVPINTVTGNVPQESERDYEALAERVLQLPGFSTETPRSLAVTSWHLGEGVSTVSAHLAYTLARRFGSRVLLVDANLKNPSLHQELGLSLSPGLSDILENGDIGTSVIQRIPDERISLLSAGAERSGPFSSSEYQALADLMRELKAEFPLILVDTPAMCEGSHATSIGHLVDRVILIVEAERVRWEVVQRAKERLAEADANILGVVLNKRRYHIPDWLYRTL